MVELNSDSESSIDSDYMIDEENKPKIKSVKENKKPKPDIRANRDRTITQNSRNLRVNTKGSEQRNQVNLNVEFKDLFTINQ